MKRAAPEQWLTPAAKKGKGTSKGGGKPVARPPASSGGKGTHSNWDAGVPTMTYAFKALVTDAIAAALLGGGGSVKETIQQDTGARLVLSNRNDYYPHSNYRVVGIYGDAEESLNGVFEHIVTRIAELGEEDRKNPPPHGSDLLGKEPGEYVFRFCITRKMCTLVIGNGGQTVSNIRHDTGAKVFIDNETYGGHRSGRIIGSQESILKAAAMVSKLVQKDCLEPNFVDFAKVINFSEKDLAALDDLFFDPMAGDKKGKSGGKDKGKGGKHQGKWDAPWEGQSQSSNPLSPPSSPQLVAPKGKGKGGTGSTPGPAASYVPPRHSGKGGSSSPVSTEGPVAVAARHRSGAPTDHNSNSNSNSYNSKSYSSSNGGGGGNGSAAEASSAGQVEDMIARLNDELSLFPEGTLDVSYSIDCELPLAQLESMQSDSEGPSYISQIKDAFPSLEINPSDPPSVQEPDTEEIQRLSIVGPLPHIYAAHAMLMLRSHQLYIDWWSEEAGEASPVQDDDPEALKARILELQEMLKKANGG